MADAVAAMSIVVPKEYPLVILSAVILCVECYLLGFIAVAPVRGKFMTKEFLEENFKDEHEKAFPGKALAPGGFPDCGEGRYAQKLPYD